MAAPSRPFTRPTLLAARVATLLDAQGFERYGLFGSTRNTFYAVVLSYAAYGWLASHQQEEDGDKKELALKKALGKDTLGLDSGNQSASAALRTTAVTLTSVVWTSLAAAFSGLHSFMAQSCTRIRGDSSPTSTSLIHSHKQPQQGLFSAFDTTYPSHVLTDKRYGSVCMAAVGDSRATSLLAPSGAARCAGSSSTAAATSRTLRSAPYPTHDHSGALLVTVGATAPLLPKRRRHYPPQEQATASFRHFPLDPSRLGSAGRTFRNVLELVSTDGGFSFEMPCKTRLLRACFRVAGFQCLTPPHANTEEGRMYTVYPYPSHTPKTTEVTFSVSFFLLWAFLPQGERGEVGATVDMCEHLCCSHPRRKGADTETAVCALLHDIRRGALGDKGVPRPRLGERPRVLRRVRHILLGVRPALVWPLLRHGLAGERFASRGRSARPQAFLVGAQGKSRGRARP
mmetsp:Transcript_73194/g.143198  ORF Transcript_73194/g.143198 Transcript_73194/m.143198 type:complete len:457 (-) Transcript_73194:203-1573(-)